MQQTTNKGFTLIELLVVIAVIGILSAIGLVSLNGAREKARDAKRKSDLAQIKTALVLYYDDFGGYPANPISGDTATPVGDATNPNFFTSAIVPRYLNSLPSSPTTNFNEYDYNYITPFDDSILNQSYALLAHLEAPGRTTVYILNSNGVGGVFTRSAPQIDNYDGYTCASAPGKNNGLLSYRPINYSVNLVSY